MSDLNSIDFELVWRCATDAFALDPDSLHGPEHWQRVEANGLWIGERTGADLDVVRLFAALHDTQRQDECTDPEHGQRGAAFARQLWNDAFHLEYERFAVLEYAILYHADGKLSGDRTVGTCWDADRLDLPRVGIMPRPELLCTEAARFQVRSLRTPYERWSV